MAGEGRAAHAPHAVARIGKDQVVESWLVVEKASHSALHTAHSDSSALCALPVELDEGGQPTVKGGSAARHQTRLEHLEDLLAGGAQTDGALHVRHEPGLLRPAEGEERDGHELAHLGGDVAAVAQTLLIDPVVRLHEVRI